MGAHQKELDEYPDDRVLDDFQRFLSSCALDKSGISIERVNVLLF